MSDMPPPPPPPPPPMAPPPGYRSYGGDAPANYAGFGARLGSYIIDGLISGLFVLPAIIALFAGPRHEELCTVDGELAICKVPDGGTIAVAVVLGLVGWGAFLYLWSKKVGTTGQSWGMSAANTRVVDATTGTPIGQGRAVGRWFARIISSWICYLGFFWMLWDPRKQTWHDKMVKSIVVKA